MQVGHGRDTDIQEYFCIKLLIIFLRWLLGVVYRCFLQSAKPPFLGVLVLRVKFFKIFFDASELPNVLTDALVVLRVRVRPDIF